MPLVMLSALSSAFSSTFSADLRSQVGVAVARKTLDAAEAQGDAAVAMIKDAAAVGAQTRRSGLTVTARPGPSQASRGPISARPTLGETGGRLDVTA